jgi:hypothetical protein
MIDWGTRLKLQHAALTGALAAVSLPSIALTAAYDGLRKGVLKTAALIMGLEPQKNTPPEILKESGGRMLYLLPEDHDISKIARDMADQVGLKVDSIHMHYAPKFYNASIYKTGKDSVGLQLYGNPLQEKDGYKILVGTLGHEFGHTPTIGSDQIVERAAQNTSAQLKEFSKNGTYAAALVSVLDASGIKGDLNQAHAAVERDEQSFVAEGIDYFSHIGTVIADKIDSLSLPDYDSALSLIADTYPLIEKGMGFIHDFGESLISNPISPLLLGASAISLAAATGIATLRRTSEYIADDYSARHFGFENSKIALTYMQDLSTGFKESGPQSPKSAWKNAVESVQTIRQKAHNFLNGTHPPPPDRLDALNRAFTQSAQPETAPPAEHPAPGQRTRPQALPGAHS